VKRISDALELSLDHPSLMSLLDAFGTDEECRIVLEELRWPKGPRCIRCDSDKLSRIYERDQFDCDACGYQFSVMAGTIFHDSHLPLRKWFVATFLICEAKKGISALQLKRTLGVSYKTAWYLTHRIRAAMVGADTTQLTGIVEADETYIGGKSKGFANKREAARGRLANKTVVLGAMERGGRIRLRVAPNNRKHHIGRFLAEVVADDATAIYTDELRSYDHVGDHNTIHESVNHKAKEWVRGQVHTNTAESAWSLFDRAVIGSYHQLSRKHLPAYLAEFEFRFNNRENPYLFRDTLTRLLTSENLPYRTLTA
jgi:transposase-like protein